ncbi:universal stress protein [Candidatus Neomarinimicrobiota bacterium]
MRFLVAISSKEYSENTLRIGSDIADAFHADLSVVSVVPKPREILASGVELAQDAMLNWSIMHPGMENLNWAYERLQAYNFISHTDDTFDPRNLVTEGDRHRMVVAHVHGAKISLILREGEVLGELHKETEGRDYLLTIVGGGQKGRLTRQLIQFVDTSVMFVKNFDPDWKYRLLICVDDSKATKKAVVFGGRIAQELLMEVDLVTVSKTKIFGKEYRGAADWAARYFDRHQVAYKQHFITGEPSTVFADFAGSERLIIMGKSKMHPLKAWLAGTTPGDTVLKANCPVIIVK